MSARHTTAHLLRYQFGPACGSYSQNIPAGTRCQPIADEPGTFWIADPAWPDPKTMGTVRHDVTHYGIRVAAADVLTDGQPAAITGQPVHAVAVPVPVNRYLTAAEHPGPWNMLGLFEAAEFQPWAFDAVEVSPVAVWAAANGDVSAERIEAGDEAPVSCWSVYLHSVNGGVECVADLPTELAAVALGAALCGAYGFESTYAPGVEPLMIASGLPRYVIEPQWDVFAGTGQDGTNWSRCPEDNATQWAVLRYEPGGERGDAEPVHDAPSRKAAVEFIRDHREAPAA